MMKRQILFWVLAGHLFPSSCGTAGEAESTDTAAEQTAETTAAAPRANLPEGLEVGGTCFGQTAGFNKLFYTVCLLAVEKKSADFASWYASQKTAAEATIADYYQALTGQE